MLDPLSALSVAGTIVQFVEFGSELLSEGRELYKTGGSGQLLVDTELELVANDLSAVITKLRGSMRSGTTGTTASVPLDAEFEKICGTASSLAQELREKLKKMKVNRREDSKWKSLRQIIKVVWSRDEIDRFATRLSSLREAINTRISSVLL